MKNKIVIAVSLLSVILFIFLGTDGDILVLLAGFAVIVIAFVLAPIFYFGFKKRGAAKICFLIIFSVFVGSFIGLGIHDNFYAKAQKDVEKLAAKIVEYKEVNGEFPKNLNTFEKEEVQVKTGFISKHPIHYKVKEDGSDFSLFFYGGALITVKYSGVKKEWGHID